MLQLFFVAVEKNLPRKLWKYILPPFPYGNTVRPIRDYARSSLEVAEYQLSLADGNLNLARDYLERVAGSNSEDVSRAADLLKIVKSRLMVQENLGAENQVAHSQDANL